jgi:ribosomal-protein-alanine N-acetyltransferase
VTVRDGTAGDLEAIERLQQASPSAAQWQAADYLPYRLLVAEEEGRVIGFLVSRDGPDDTEILNLAVDPGMRRKGVARLLVDTVINIVARDVFLEVRKSNLGAIAFYEKYGFCPIGVRRNYYSAPQEDGIVMCLKK